MKVLDKYKLFLRWSEIKQGDRVILLKGAYFSGPVLKDAMKLRNGDFILLDLTEQFFPIFNSFFIVELSWGAVQYKDNKIFLNNAILHSDHFSRVIELFPTDKILIDTSKHEIGIHEFNLTYPAAICDEYGSLCVFEG